MRFQTIVAPTITELFERQIQGMILSGQVEPGVPADFGGDSNTLIIHNEDTPGCIAEVTTCLAVRRINVASMQVFRAGTGGYAVMVLECDSHIPHPLERKLATLPGILKVTCLNIDEPEEDAEE